MRGQDLTAWFPGPKIPTMFSLSRPHVPQILLGLFLSAGIVGCTSTQAPPPSVHVDDSRSEDAETEFRKRLNSKPNDSEAHHRLGQILATQGNAIEADLHFTKAVQIDASRRSRVNLDRERYASQFQSKAVEFAGEGSYESAGRALNQADTMLRGLPRTLYLRGRLAQSQGDPLGAREYYEQALEKLPDNAEYTEAYVEVLLELGRERNQEQDFEGARRLLEDAAELSSSPDVDYLLGTVLYSMAQASSGEEQQAYLVEAAESFRAVLDKAPKDEDARYNLGAVLLSSGQFEEAVGIYESLILDNPRDGDLFLALSLAHGRTGQSEMAMAEDAIGRALRENRPVDAPATWARRATTRFENSDLASTYRRLGSPEAIYTYSRLGGDLVEVWFYWDQRKVIAFQDGGRYGVPVDLPRD